MRELSYDNVIDQIAHYYNTEPQWAWNVVNEYNLTPQELAQLLPEGNRITMFGDGGDIADGVYQQLNNAGQVSTYYQVTTVPMSNGNVAQSAINSNTQNGTYAVAEKVKFAGNSVIDQNGKVKTSPGVNQYKNGVLQTDKLIGTAASVVQGVGAVATGISLGKKIDARLYNANPTFWDSLGLSTLDPSTWQSITSSLPDTGSGGALKTAVNFILGIDGNGNTQAYMDADAYDYMAWALAKNGFFEEGGGAEASVPSGGTWNPALRLSSPNIPLYTSGELIHYQRTWRSYLGFRVLSTNNCYVYMAAVPVNGGTLYRIAAIRLANGPSASVTYQFAGESSSLENMRWSSVMTANVSSTGGIIGTSQIYNGVTYTQNQFRSWYDTNAQVNTRFSDIISNTFTPVIETQSSDESSSQTGIQEAIIICFGTIEQHSAIEGETDQNGATVPTGITRNSSLQDVKDALRSQYPDLENNRLEQSVVQPDGSTIIKKYYPVPLPNDAVNTTIDNPTPVTTENPIKIILPINYILQLPDGTTIPGDGSTVVEIPPGQYTLPSDTIIINNYITNESTPDGGTQPNPEVTDDSTDALKLLLLKLLTSPDPQSLVDSDSEPIIPADTDTDTNDMGDGTTPPVIVPVGSASALWSVYNPTLSEINSLGAWLWSNNFVDQLLKMFNDPMQAIIGLHKTFIPPITDSRQDIKVGYLNSGVSALTVPTQYSTIDCGSVQLSEYFGNVFDYSPYTRVFIYLPFIGFKELDVSQVMRSTINVKYHGDAYTGTGLAEISVTRDAGAGGILYTYGCECAVRYPLSQGSYMGFATAVAGLAVGVASGNVAPALLGFAHGSSKPAVEHSGSYSGNSGAMGIKIPYLVVMRPQTAMPRNYSHFSGSPSSIYTTIASTSGLIRVRECHVENIANATKEEKIMIDTALHEGILV